LVLAGHEQRHAGIRERRPERAALAMAQQPFVHGIDARPERGHGTRVPPRPVGLGVQTFAKVHRASRRSTHAPQYIRAAELMLVVDLPPKRRDENTGTSSVG